MAPLLALEDMRENEVAVRNTYYLTAQNIYSEPNIHVITPMPPTPPFMSVTQWFKHYYQLSLANNADADEPLPIKSGNPTIRNTRKITTDYSNKIRNQ